MDGTPLAPGADERPLAWLARVCTLPALLLFALGYRLWWRGSGAPLGGFDERLYVRFAQAFHEGGLPALRDLLARYPADPVLSRGPLPLRLLWVGSSAWACGVAGRCDAAVLADLSWLAGLATLLLAWRLFRRWLPPAPSLLALLLVAISPLATDLSQRALQDAFFTFWVVAAIFFVERIHEANRWGDQLALAGCVLAGLLTKESMALLLPLLVVGAGGPRRRVLATSAALAGAALAAFAVLAVAAGGVGALVEVYRQYEHAAATEPYTVQAQGGPWFRYLVDLLLLSPATVLFALAGLILAPADEALAPGARRAALYTVGGLAILSALPVLSVRYVLFADVLLRALAAAGVFALAGRARAELRKPLLAGGAALLVATEIVQFRRVFVAGAVYDPVTAELVQANGMVRWH